MLEKFKRLDKWTVIRTAILFLALANQLLVILGKSPIPINDAQITALISTAWTIGSGLMAWWFNNNFTSKAIQAQEVLNYLRSADADNTEEDNQGQLEDVL